MPTTDSKDADVAPSQSAAQSPRTSEKLLPSLVEHLKSFPADVDVGDKVFAWNPAPSRSVDF
jgi:hypothetical protein